MTAELQPPANSFASTAAGWPRAIAWAGLCAGLFLLHALFYQGDLVDDPYISYRYARNWAAGHGLEFNPGERVEGYSNFLHVALLALGIKLGASPVDLGPALGYAASLSVLLFLALRSGGSFAPRRGVAALMLACSGVFAFWPPRGLETPLYATLLFFGLWLAGSTARDSASRVAGRWIAAWLLLALAGMTRVEGPMFCLVVGLWGLTRFVRHRSTLPRGWALGFWGGSVGALAILAAYHGWRLWYFGRPFPNTFYAKATGSLADRLPAGARYLLHGALTQLLPIVATVALAGVATWWLARRGATSNESRENDDAENPSTSEPASLAPAQRWLFGWAVAAQAFFAFWVGGDWMPLGRFLAPVVAILALLAEDAWVALLARLDRREAARDLCAGALALLLCAGLWRELGQTGSMMRCLRRGQLTQPIMLLAWWMADNLPPEHTVAGEEAGFIPWHTNMPFLDMHGLVTRGIADRPGGLHKHDSAWILAQRPEYMVLTAAPQEAFDRATVEGAHPASKEMLKLDAFWESYELLRRQRRGEREFALDMLLFRRKDVPPPRR